MQTAPIRFKARANARLEDPVLQHSLQRFKSTFVPRRAQAIAALSDFEAYRDAAAAIRDGVLADLDIWLELFEQRAQSRGVHVRWAETPQDVNRIVVEIAQSHRVRKIVKSKSMVSEESHLDRAIEAAGLQVVETDLGEYILQLNDYEPPSHIVAPVFHKSLAEVAELFERKHGTPRKTEAQALTREARAMLREHFLSAGMGITGANFLVAETGSVVLVTNEGNASLGVSLPPVHVVVTTIEKLVPTLEDAATLLRLLPRSALGQSIVNYVDVMTGVRSAGDAHGARHVYIVLADSGRSALLASSQKAALRCIRCGACMNHCPVYQHVGGHSYGWVYPGPIGAVLTPAYQGLEHAIELPHACTLCGQCASVCPVKIPLPELQRELREQQTVRGLRPRSERLALRLWAWGALHPRLYGASTRIAARVLAWWGGRDGRIRRLPLGGGGGWTAGRDLIAPSGRTFKELWRERRQH